MSNNKRINQNLKRLRENSGLKQNYVADQLGITRNYYSQIENGTRNVQMHHLPKLRDILNIDINDLFFEFEIANCDSDEKEVS